MEFSNKVVIITGASAGIGAAAAKKFAELSADLVIVGRNVENLNAVAKECEQKGSKVLPIVADVSVDSDLERIVKDTIDTFGRIDVLVNNAGVFVLAGILDGIEAYDKTMATNVRAMYLLTSLAAPHIIKTKGSIIQVSSIAGAKPARSVLAYCVSKAAVNMFTKAVALELAPHGVRVNALSPGETMTNMLKKGQADLAEVGQKIPPNVLGRFSDADEMADMIVYMASWKARNDRS